LRYINCGGKSIKKEILDKGNRSAVLYKHSAIAKRAGIGGYSKREGMEKMVLANAVANSGLVTG
jgi:hypothetical protein